ncbi:MAG: complex I subunit 1/NuoH family protein [Bacteroidota bacterium]
METLLEIVAIPMVTTLLLAFIPLVFIVVYALVVLYMEMKVAAHIQNRLAYMENGWHGTLQPFADMLKLLQKEDIIPAAADKLFFIMAPYIVFVGTYASFAVLPFSSGFIGSNIDLGIFYLVAVSSLVVVGLLMSGWASNNKWSLLGALRSAAQIVSYEIPAVLSILGVVMVCGTLNMQEMTVLQDGGIQNWLIFGGNLPLWQKLSLIPFVFLLFIIYLLSSMAEVNRTPFDLPEAESELVQGFNTEYSGMKFAMFYLAEYANLFLVSAVAVIMFFGGWTSPFGEFMSGPVWSAFWFVLKGMSFVFLSIWLRWTLPRLRVDQLMYVSWKVLTPFAMFAILAIGLIMVL